MRKRTFGCRALKRRGQRSDHAERGRDRGDADLSGKAVLEGVDLLAHRAGIADDAARPVERPFPLGRKALEPRPALHQHDAEDFLELLQAGRHRRLGDAAGLGGASKMTFLGQRQQQFKLVDQKAASRFTLRQRIPRPPPDNQAKSRLKKRPHGSNLSMGIRIFKSSDFDILIDRLSVLQHETALLISGSIPVLMGW